MAASAARLGVLTSQVVHLQGTIRQTEGRIGDLQGKIANSDSDTGNSDRWWLALYKRYIRLLKWQRNRKFLQKRNIRLLQNILKRSDEHGVMEKRKLLGLLKQYETTQRKLTNMVNSQKYELDKDFLKELNELQVEWIGKSEKHTEALEQEGTEDKSTVDDVL